MADASFYIISEEEEGRTVGQFLKNRLQFSAAHIRSLKFAPEGLTVNGERARTDRILCAGDRLAVPADDSAARPQRLLPYEGVPRALQVLYEDESLIVVDKPAGLAMHPAGGHTADTLANLLRSYFDSADPKARVHFAGRLDKDTSGVVLCAKTALAAEKLQKEKARGGFQKTYFALAAGSFRPGAAQRIDLPLRAAEDPDSGLIRMYADPFGKPALTYYTVRQVFPAYALLELRLDTGRMHQIRAHLAAAGHPLLGDPLYGEKAESGEGLISRCALHAAEICFLHPEDGRQITLSAPLPADMAALTKPVRSGADPFLR